MGGREGDREGAREEGRQEGEGVFLNETLSHCGNVD